MLRSKYGGHVEATASVNSVVPSHSTWSSVSWNYDDEDDQAMFEKLSLIEAEMDECLMDSVKNKEQEQERETRTPTAAMNASNEDVRKERRCKVDFKWPQEEMTSSVNIGESLSKKSSKDVIFSASVFSSPSLTQWHSTVDSKDRASSAERKESVEVVSLRCESVSVPVNLNNNNNTWSKKATPPNGLVHRCSAIISADHKDSIAANNSPEFFARYRGVLSGGSELGVWLKNGNRPRSKDSGSDVDFTKLIDRISESFGTRVKFVDNALSCCSRPVRKDLCLVTSAVTSQQRCSAESNDDVGRIRTDSDVKPDDRQSYSLSSDLDDGDDSAGARISIVLTPELTETSSGSEAELFLFGAKCQPAAATTAEFHEDCSNLSLTRCLSESSSSSGHPIYPAGKICDAGDGNLFKSIPPVTISSPDDDSDSPRRPGNLCPVPDESLPCLDARLKSPFTNEQYIRSNESLRIKNVQMNDDDMKSVSPGRSPEFLTVEMSKSLQGDCSDVDCNNATTGTRGWMGSTSSLSDQHSSSDEVIVGGSSFHFNDLKKVTSKISCFDNFRMFCCTFQKHSSGETTRTRIGSRLQIVLSRKVSRNERKASKVLGIILLAFVIFWSPFFLVNILSVTCKSCDVWLNSTFVTCVVWWGYASSLANPVIYTLFSKSFRMAFRRILTCRCSYYMKRTSTWQKETRHKSGNAP